MDLQDLEIGKMYLISGRMLYAQVALGSDTPVAIYLGCFVDKTFKTFAGDHPTMYEFLVGDKIRNFSDNNVMQYIGVVKQEEDKDPK